MNRKELIQAISASTKVNPASVRAVIEAVVAHLQSEMKNGERAQLAGFGTFIKRAPKEEGKPTRFIFRPAGPKGKKKGGKEAKTGGGEN